MVLHSREAGEDTGSIAAAVKSRKSALWMLAYLLQLAFSLFILLRTPV